jgi:hypothetical protein
MLEVKVVGCHCIIIIVIDPPGIGEVMGISYIRFEKLARGGCGMIQDKIEER